MIITLVIIKLMLATIIVMIAIIPRGSCPYDVDTPAACSCTYDLQRCTPCYA